MDYSKLSGERKRELAGLCCIEIKRWKAAADSNPNMRYMVELMDVALASLTAESGWIKCSEQVPTSDGAYLCWDGRYVTTYAFIFGSWQANQFVARNITHWMPLPAPPEE